MKDFSSRLKEVMVFKNISQAELVRRTGISKGALSSYLSGKYDPKQNNIYMLSKALNCNPLYLLGYTDDPIDYESEEFDNVCPPNDFMPYDEPEDRIKGYLGYLEARDADVAKEMEEAELISKIRLIDPRFNDFKFALMHGENDLSEDQKEDLLNYYEFIKSKKR